MTATIHDLEGEALFSKGPARERSAPTRLSRYLGQLVLSSQSRRPEWTVQFHRRINGLIEFEIVNYSNHSAAARLLDGVTVEEIKMEPEMFADIMVEAMIADLERAEMSQ